MKILIRSAQIIDSSSPHHNSKKDILISNGRIEKIGKKISPSDDMKIIEGKGLCVSQGWIDMRANFCEPGHEYKEDISSGLKAAAKGGYTGVLSTSNTHPAIDNRASVEFMKNRSKGSIVDLYPLGTVSEGREGKELAEMYDMHQGGAIAFSDNKKTIKNNKLLFKALTYSQSFNGLIMDFPMDHDWIDEGQMHEGLVSTNMGVKGIPEEAESIMVQRDISMLEYAGGRLHIGPISTKLSVDLIKKAKGNGLQISAEVSHHSLLLKDEDAASFDANMKFMPPLRDEKNRKALIKALKEGVIDVISSDHSPEDEDEKKIEFLRAAYGAVGLETCYAVANETIEDQEVIVDKLAMAPRRILGIEASPIKEGEKANLTVFDPSKEWVIEEKSLQSKSKNSPYIGRKMRGKAVAVINASKLSLL